MPLQLRVLETGQLIEVPNEGQTIGREGGPADIQLSDKGLSSRHARIFADGPDWLVQDMGSTNGTFLGEMKVGTPTEIRVDDIITLAGTKLEVVKVWDPLLQQTMMMPAPIFDTKPSVPAVSRAPAAAKSGPSSVIAVRPADDEADAPSAPTMLGTAAVIRKSGASHSRLTAEEEENANEAGAATMIGYGAPAAATMETPVARAQETTEMPEVGEPPEASDPPDAGDSPSEEPAAEAAPSEMNLKYFLVAVPKAIAFYLAAIPLMIVNPIGTIRKGVETQKHEAKGRMELIAYALPVNLFSAAVGFISTLIVQLVTGTLSIGGLIIGMLVVPAIVAVITSVITGFVWHPVTKWIITKLKGESDDRSRTNYFLMFMTATALVALPSGIGTILGLVPFRLVAMVQPILSALGSVVLIFVTYSWMTSFNVVKWFRTVLLVLGGLAILGGVFGVIGRLTTPAGSGALVAGGSAGDVEAQIAAAQKQAEEATKAAAEATDDAKAAMKEGMAEAKEATDDAKAAAKPSTKVTAAKEVAAKDPVAVAAVAPAAAEKAGEPSVTYPVYVQMRDSVEKSIADDPSVLNRSPELLALYHGYTTATFEVDSKFKALNEKNPADAKLNVRLREAELFAKTEKSVKALYAKLKPSGAAEAPAAKEEKAKAAEAKPAPAAKEEKPAAVKEAKPAAAAKEEKPAPAAKEAKPAPTAKEAKPAPAAKEEKPAAAKEAKPAPAAKEEKPKAAEAAKPAGKGKLACSSKPAQADIWVDGKNTGKKTPLAVSSALDLPAGKHTVIFKLNGKASAPVEVTIEADKPTVLKGVEIPGA